MTNITQVITIVDTTCGVCGIHFGLERNFLNDRCDDGRTFHCPNGDRISWRAENKAANEQRQLQERLEREQQYRQRAEVQANGERAQRRLAERQRAAAKGQVTKIKNRVGNGVCPCCNRTFANLARHIQGQHPDFTGEPL